MTGIMILMILNRLKRMINTIMMMLIKNIPFKERWDGYEKENEEILLAWHDLRW